MQKIKIATKYIAMDKDTLKEVALLGDIDTLVEIVNEEQSKEPTISKSPLSGHIQQIIDAGTALLQADSVVRIWYEGVVLYVGTALWKRLMKLIKSNNKKRGNMIGVKITIEKNVNNQSHRCDFVCDDIPEGSLEDALSKIQPTLDNMAKSIGEEYLKQIKDMAFVYNTKEGWKLTNANKIETE